MYIYSADLASLHYFSIQFRQIGSSSIVKQMNFFHENWWKIISTKFYRKFNLEVWLSKLLIVENEHTYQIFITPTSDLKIRLENLRIFYFYFLTRRFTLKWLIVKRWWFLVSVSACIYIYIFGSRVTQWSVRLDFAHLD